MRNKMKTKFSLSKNSVGLLFIVSGLLTILLNVYKSYSKEEFELSVFITGLVLLLVYYTALVWSIVNYHSGYHGKTIFYILSILFLGLILINILGFGQNANFVLLLWCSRLFSFSLPLFGGVTLFFKHSEVIPPEPS